MTVPSDDPAARGADKGAAAPKVAPAPPPADQPPPHTQPPPYRPQPPRDTGIFDSLARLFGAGLKTIADAVPARPAPQPLLTFREVVSYLVDRRPAEAATCRGALLRQRERDAYVFRLLFIDATGEPIVDAESGRRIGRTVRAYRCDEELAEMFGSHDLIVFD